MASNLLIFSSNQLFILLLVVGNTFAWFIYTTKVDNKIDVHVRAWNVLFQAGEQAVRHRGRQPHPGGDRRHPAGRVLAGGDLRPLSGRPLRAAGQKGQVRRGALRPAPAADAAAGGQPHLFHPDPAGRL